MLYKDVVFLYTGLEPPTAEKVSMIKEELERLDEQTKANNAIPSTSDMKIAIMKEIIGKPSF